MPQVTYRDDRIDGRVQRRDLSLDIAKGFGIFLVVLGHCLIGLKTAGFLAPTLPWPQTTINLIYIFHMPLFFLISGHLASGKHRAAGQTIGKLLVTVMYPYFLWTIVQAVVQVYLSRFTNTHSSWDSLKVLYRILWVPIVPYWFLYALFLCQLGYLAVRRLSHGVQLAIALVLFAIPQFFLVEIGQAYLLLIPETVRGFLYFIVGVISVTQVKQLGRWAAVAGTVLFAVFAMVVLQSQLAGEVEAAAEVPVAIAGMTATIAWSRLLAGSDGWFARAVAFCGRYSMSIYVMHIFFTAGMRILLGRFGIKPTLAGTLLEIAAAVAVGIAVPLGINWVASRMRLDVWMGIQRMEPRRN